MIYSFLLIGLSHNLRVYLLLLLENVSFLNELLFLIWLEILIFSSSEVISVALICEKIISLGVTIMISYTELLNVSQTATCVVTCYQWEENPLPPIFDIWWFEEFPIDYKCFLHVLLT